MRQTERPAILVASRDPSLADVRKRVLERAGFLVITASDSETVSKTCTERKILLLMLGYSLAVLAKYWFFVRKPVRPPASFS